MVQEIEGQGHQNAVLFAVTADHGQHTFRNKKEFVLLTEEVGKLFKTKIADGGMQIVPSTCPAEHLRLNQLVKYFNFTS